MIMKNMFCVSDSGLEER